ncbi:cbb3-type cytochrome oxidase assembly protein CcoS [uncultured Endozoicomonas sp.]|uniref:cbb3-type cytochrome oxidase assembly protein CcoS n=1 Tax=uncultured Endozoicomonas sp. TaxID=432652 RepID=UPI00262549A2|nr:cbb3-type cytochrome oxidase assembly protein CcoS [uncultured Endozoicomonas sp.]
MESLIILIPIALVLIALAVKIFFWAVDDGQFDDLEGPAHSILFDEPQRKSSSNSDTTNTSDNNQ